MERNITYESMNACCVSQSVSQSCQSVLMCVKVEWRNNVSLRKGKNCAILQVKDLIKNIVKFNVQKMLCTLTSCTKHLFEAHKINNVHRNKLKVYISLKGNKLILVKVHVRCTVCLVHDSCFWIKNIIRGMLLHGGTHRGT